MRQPKWDQNINLSLDDSLACVETHQFDQAEHAQLTKTRLSQCTDRLNQANTPSSADLLCVLKSNGVVSTSETLR